MKLLLVTVLALSVAAKPLHRRQDTSVSAESPPAAEPSGPSDPVTPAPSPPSPSPPSPPPSPSPPTGEVSINKPLLEPCERNVECASRGCYARGNEAKQCVPMNIPDSTGCFVDQQVRSFCRCMTNSDHRTVCVYFPRCRIALTCSQVKADSVLEKMLKASVSSVDRLPSAAKALLDPTSSAVRSLRIIFFDFRSSRSQCLARMTPSAAPVRSLPSLSSRRRLTTPRYLLHERWRRRRRLSTWLSLDRRYLRARPSMSICASAPLRSLCGFAHCHADRLYRRCMRRGAVEHYLHWR